MKKVTKAFKLISVARAVFLLITALPLSSFAAETSFDYTVNSDGTCTLTAINRFGRVNVSPETWDTAVVAAYSDNLTFTASVVDVTA